MINKVLGLVKRHKKLVVVLCLLATIVVVGVIIFARTSTEKPAPNSDKSILGNLPTYDYTYISSDVACKQVQPNPSTPETVNYCSGTLKAKPVEGNDISSFKVTGVTIFYNKNGVQLETSKLNQLVSGKSKLSITTYPKDTLATNIFSKDQLN